MPARFFLVLTTCLAISATASAQLHPRLTVLSPCGGQAGTPVKVTLTGVDLDDVTTLMIHPAGPTAHRIPDPAKKDQFLPNQFEIRIPPETPPGSFDIRAVCKWGVTNPRAFIVGELPEVQEKEPNNDVPQAQPITLNSTVNGVISAPSDVDYFSFAAKKGEHIIVWAVCDAVDSLLEADVRIFNATGRLLAANRPRSAIDPVCSFIVPADATYLVRLASNAHIAGSPDCYYRLTVSTRPWIDAVFPPLAEPGKAAQVTLLGRNLPGGQTAASPPLSKGGMGGVSPAQQQNLLVTLTPPADPLADQRWIGAEWLAPSSAGLDGFFYRLKNSAGWSNAVPIGYAKGPVILENSDHATPAKAQIVPIPAELVGRIERRDDRDWYAFSGKKGEVVAIEAFAERLGVPVDLFLELQRADNGSLIGEFDDHPDQPQYHRFYARTDDPALRFTLPADGRYDLMVTSRDATLRGDPRLVYRISLHRPKPDFRAVIVDSLPQMPASLCLHPGDRQHWDVVVYRRDGFTGPIQLTAEGLPPGVTCPPQMIPEGTSLGSLVVSAADQAADFSGDIKVKAAAVIDGQTITREVRPGCLVWPNPNEPNNAPGISRLCRAVVLAVRQEKPPFRISFVSDKAAVPAGGAVNIKIKTERLWPDAKQPITITPIHLPPGVSFNNNQPLTIAPDKNEAEARLQTPANLAAESFPLILRGISQIPYNKDPKAKQKPNTAMYASALPATVTVYRRVADATLTPGSLTLKPGAEAAVTIKITRLFDYQGPLQVQIQGLPAGVTAANLTVPEKAVEAKLTLKAAPNAADNPGASATIKLTGSLPPANLTTETKLTIAVKK